MVRDVSLNPMLEPKERVVYDLKGFPSGDLVNKRL